MVVSNIVHVHPYLGKIPNLTNICLKGVDSTTNYQVFMCSNNSKEKNGRQNLQVFPGFPCLPPKRPLKFVGTSKHVHVVSISLFLSNAQMKNENDPRVANKIGHQH